MLFPDKWYWSNEGEVFNSPRFDTLAECVKDKFNELEFKNTDNNQIDNLNDDEYISFFVIKNDQVYEIAIEKVIKE